MNKANFGVMGLGVMGHMLALNMERNGFKVVGYDLDGEKVRAFGADSFGKNLVSKDLTTIGLITAILIPSWRNVS